MSAKLKKTLNLLEKLKLIIETDEETIRWGGEKVAGSTSPLTNGNEEERERAKCLRNVASQFGIYVGAVNNILKRKREYENIGEPLGWTPLYSEHFVWSRHSRDCSL